MRMHTEKFCMLIKLGMTLTVTLCSVVAFH